MHGALAHADRQAAPGVRWWIVCLAAAFGGYYTLLVFCDLTRPELFGFAMVMDGPAVRIEDVRAGTPAERAGLQKGDRIVQANGRVVEGRLDWIATGLNLRTGDPLALLIEREGARRPFTLTASRAPLSYWTSGPGATVLCARLVQLAALVLAVTVILRRPGEPSARMGALVLAGMAAYSVDWPYQLTAVWRALPAPAELALWLPFAGSLALPALLFTFFATFPQPVLRTRWIVLAWIPMLSIVALIVRFAVGAIHDPLHGQTGPDWAPLFGGATAAYTLGTIAVLVIGYRRLTDVTERRRVRILVTGSAIGLLNVMPVAALYWSRPGRTEHSIFASPWTATATLLGLLVPLSFAYAILRHRLFNVGSLVRAGLQYALARRVLLSLVPAALVLFVIDLWRHPTPGDALQAHGWGYVAVAVVALVARLRRDHWLETLDRRFFRERYQAERLLRAIGEDVRGAPGFAVVASSTVGRIEAALHPMRVAILQRGKNDPAYRAVASAPVTTSIDPLPAGSRLVGLVQWMRTPLHAAGTPHRELLQGLPPDEVAWLYRAGIELLVPIRRADATDALLVLGAKRSEEPYSGSDEDLLMAIALSLETLPAGVPSELQSGTFNECPECGRCFDAGASRCGRDNSSLAAQPLPRLLVGRYRLDRRIGRGGMGTVYETFDTALSRAVAAKLLREDVVDALGGSVERFTAEARLAAALVHPNVVTIHDIGIAGSGRPFFVMELLHGVTLREELRRRTRLPATEVRELLRGVCSAVDAAHHRNIIHRDLKPENIFICRGEAGETVKVLDFGLARPVDVIDGNRLTRPGVVGGTPCYMSPEHLRGDDPSPDWDLWAIAAIAFEMIAGRPPPPGPAAPGAAELPPSIQDVFARALSPNPIVRPESAADFLHALGAALNASHERQI